MNNFPFIGPGGLKEQHRRKSFEFGRNYATSSKVCVVLPASEWSGKVSHATALVLERKRHENLIVGALDSWGASPEAVYRAVMTYDNR